MGGRTADGPAGRPAGGRRVAVGASGRVGRHAATGLTLVEILIALAVFGVSAAGVFQAFRYAQAAVVASGDRLRGVLLATDLVEEIRTRALVEPETGVAPVWGLEAGETHIDRSSLDDIDDYDGLAEAPPCDPVGNEIPGLAGWRRRVDVATVEADDPTRTAPPGTTPLRRVRVVVERDGAVMADVTVLAAGR